MNHKTTKIQRERALEQYYKNHEKRKAQQREYHKVNRKKLSEKTEEWRNNNKDKVKEKSRKWYQEHKEDEARRKKEWYQNNPDLARERHLKHCYNMTLEQYNKMFEAQKGLCAICQKQETTLGPSGKIKSLVVDHDHKTGKTRELLCTSCNKGLGMFNDNKDMLELALRYITKHSEV